MFTAYKGQQGSAKSIAGINKSTLREFSKKEPKAIRGYALHSATHAESC